jgi:hypothetical protein
MKEYEVEVSLTFYCTVKVKGNKREEAQAIAKQGFGFTAGNISTNNTRISDWDVPFHGVKRIGRARWVKAKQHGTQHQKG